MAIVGSIDSSVLAIYLDDLLFVDSEVFESLENTYPEVIWG
jgi:hypothetical protein